MIKRNMLLICGITACLASTAYAADECASRVKYNLGKDPYMSLFKYIEPFARRDRDRDTNNDVLHRDLENLHRVLLGETLPAPCDTAATCYGQLFTDVTTVQAGFPGSRIVVSDANGNVAVDTAVGPLSTNLICLLGGENSLACYQAGRVSLNLMTSLSAQEAANYECGAGTDTKFAIVNGLTTGATYSYQDYVAVRMGRYQHNVGLVSISHDAALPQS
jgi:hypothetical protein